MPTRVSKRLLLTVGPVVIGLLVGVGETAELRAQVPVPRQKFEVASIHRCGPDTVVPLREGGGFGDLGTSNNRVSRHCYTVTTLLQAAYVIFADGQNRMFSSVHVPAIEKAPGWMSSELYSIDAKAEGAPGQAVMLGPMMQSLLEDRFHLKLHRETRSGPAYELTVAKGGSKLKVNDGSCGVDLPAAAAPRDPATGKPAAGFATGRVSPPREPGVPCRLRFSLKNGPNQLFAASAITLDDFSAMLSRAAGRTIINKTGITGKFDIRLEYFPDDVASGFTAGENATPAADLQTGATLFTALEQQLGLKLTATRGTREAIVIDHIERPSGN